MFQYAFGRALADNYNLELSLDCFFLSDRSPREGFTYREFELGAFPIRAEVADDKLLRSVAAYPKNRIERLKRNLLQNTNKVGYISENGFHYTPVSPVSIKKKNYVTGFWQSEKHFKVVENNIRRDFSVVPSWSANSDKYSALIKNAEAVSIHVRRGDYVNNAFHPLCTIDYYMKAMAAITEGMQNPEFFIFSDDPAWAVANLQLKWPYHMVQGNSAATDLYLMSRCRHHIIANSSFSWWGAWLNHNKDKRVIAPQKWFGEPTINTNDLIPENWIRF